MFFDVKDIGQEPLLLLYLVGFTSSWMGEFVSQHLLQWNAIMKPHDRSTGETDTYQEKTSESIWSAFRIPAFNSNVLGTMLSSSPSAIHATAGKNSA